MSPLHNLGGLLFLATRPPCVFSHTKLNRTEPNQTKPSRTKPDQTKPQKKVTTQISYIFTSCSATGPTEPRWTPPSPTEPAELTVSAAACAGGHHGRLFICILHFSGCRTPPNQHIPVPRKPRWVPLGLGVVLPSGSPSPGKITSSLWFNSGGHTATHCAHASGACLGCC